MPENTKPSKNKGLGQDKTSAYKPAYKNFPKTAENQSQDIPLELAEIVAVWAELPVHIKAAIKALVHTHTKESE